MKRSRMNDSVKKLIENLLDKTFCFVLNVFVVWFTLERVNFNMTLVIRVDF